MFVELPMQIKNNKLQNPSSELQSALSILRQKRNVVLNKHL